ncbi:MAG: VWA domain-containing protein, partial [Deltaproteobacteria bacterium]|nr:VWA domain-containing protein [Deltaproteobacteria bacterium]
ELTAKKEQLSDAKEKLARLQGDLSEVKGRFAASKDDAKVQNIIEGRLARARQALTEEMKRLLKSRPKKITRSVGGIPVDSEYIVFIIDTSGSMQRNAWSMVQKKMRETLEIYPKVKGIQIMNDMGNFLFSQYAGKWIPDTPARRRAIISALASWSAFSNSSPVEGITAAINLFYSGNKKISLYVFGDEFSGSSVQPVINAVDRINTAAKDGSRRVRIHAVGFPVVMEKTNQRGNTGERFATLMRALCQRNGGTFVGLNSTRP